MSEEKTKTAPPAINVRGVRVGLGPFLREYVEVLTRFEQDPEVDVFGGGTFFAPHPEKALERYEQSLKNKEQVQFAIFELETLALIGRTTLRNINHREGTATLGIGISDKSRWSKGYGTEAVKLVVDYGFRFLNLHNIDLVTSGFNERAIRCYLRAGFKVIGRRREVVLIAGHRYDEVLMDCLSTEFEPPVPGWYRL